MISRSIVFAVATLGLATVFALPASASQPEPSAHLHCAENNVAVRFNLGWGIDPLARQFAAKWGNTAASADGRCILSDGKKVILKWRQLPAYAWGAGGAAPPAIFSLWIDGVRVGGGEFRGGYGDYNTFLNSLFYSPGSLTICHSDPNGRDGAGDARPFTCTAKPYDLAAQKRDASSPDYDDPRGGEMTFITSGAASFCRQFIRSQKDIVHWAGTPPPAVFTFVNRGKETKVMLAIDRARMDFVEFAEIPATVIPAYENPGVAHFDAFGTGKPQTVVRLAGDYNNSVVSS
jgi:hypothetical protein